MGHRKGLMMTAAQTVVYSDGEQELEGVLVRPKDASNLPCIMIVHDWSGLREFAIEKAEYFADKGYLAFAIDIFGKGLRGENNNVEKNSALITPYVEDRSKIVARMQAAHNVVKDLSEVNQDKVFAIGFCFGGMCVLDYARSGANINSVISVHGLLNAPSGTSAPNIKAKILALHGYKDPLAPVTQLRAFEAEMHEKNADWQIHTFGQALHAFTNPGANLPDNGIIYNQQADTRSWKIIDSFLEENS